MQTDCHTARRSCARPYLSCARRTYVRTYMYSAAGRTPSSGRHALVKMGCGEEGRAGGRKEGACVGAWREAKQAGGPDVAMRR